MTTGAPHEPRPPLNEPRPRAPHLRRAAPPAPTITPAPTSPGRAPLNEPGAPQSTSPGRAPLNEPRAPQSTSPGRARAPPVVSSSANDSLSKILSSVTVSLSGMDRATSPGCRSLAATDMSSGLELPGGCSVRITSCCSGAPCSCVGGLRAEGGVGAAGAQGTGQARCGGGGWWRREQRAAAREPPGRQAASQSSQPP